MAFASAPLNSVISPTFRDDAGAPPGTHRCYRLRDRFQWKNSPCQKGRAATVDCEGARGAEGPEGISILPATDVGLTERRPAHQHQRHERHLGGQDLLHCSLSDLQNFYDTFTSGRPCVASQLLGDSEMNIPASRNNDHLLYWMAAALLLMVFGLGDTAIVAWWASVVTFGQLVAVALALALTATGAFLTIWQMRRQAGR